MEAQVLLPQLVATILAIVASTAMAALDTIVARSLISAAMSATMRMVVAAIVFVFFFWSALVAPPASRFHRQ